ncbi:MAG: ABC transporter substrate-binding protein [Eubacterium sp.]|nr:ABC transporter substrate-binding protein [Eubacterium sp.]
MKKINILTLLLILTIFLSLTACGKSSSKEEVKQTYHQGLDKAGNEIVVPDNVETIISLSPVTTSFLIDLGLSDKIIGIDTASNIYADSLSQEISQFDINQDINQDIKDLNPDMVFISIDQTSENHELFDKLQPLQKVRICIVNIPPATSLDEISEDILAIGQLTGSDQKAKELSDKFNSEIDKYREISSRIYYKKRIFFQMSLPEPDYPFVNTAGSKTYIDDMISTIGGINAAAEEEETSTFYISLEEVAKLHPEVIVTNAYHEYDVAFAIATTAGWEKTKAVKNNEIYYIDLNTALQPNLHITDALNQMALQVYPEAFSELDNNTSNVEDSSEGDSEEAE